MSIISRRHLLAGGSAIIGAGIFPFAARAQQLRQINFITPLNYLIGYAPSLNAQAGGHFKKEGLDVTILPGKGSAVAVQQVIADCINTVCNSSTSQYASTAVSLYQRMRLSFFMWNWRNAQLWSAFFVLL